MHSMDEPHPYDHGSDRHGEIAIVAPPGISPHGEWWDAIVHEACPDCLANVTAKFKGISSYDAWDRLKWYVTTAHDDNCPMLAAMETSQR